MRSPHYFVHGSLVFARGPDDVWAGYRLVGQSYPGLSASRKLELKAQIESFAYAVETNFQLIRATREWSVEDYVERARAALRGEQTHREGYERMLAEHRELLAGAQVVRPEVFLFVRLGPPGASTPLGERLGEIWRSIESGLRLREARALGPSDLEELRVAESRLFERVNQFLPCERVRSGEVLRLIRSAYTRGVGEPRLDPNWRPQALWVDEAGRFEPYRYDLLRLHDSRVEIGARGLRVQSESGLGHQALFALGALPDEVAFPGTAAEVLFAPLEVGFAVDAVVAAEYLPNRLAAKVAQRRMVDADQQAKEESFGEHGPSPSTQEKTVAARELQARLASSDRAPLLRTGIAVALGAADNRELEARVERLRTAFGGIELHRPTGDQHRLFLATLPAQPFPLPEYKAHLLPEQFGAMVPTAIAHAGTELGPYIGHTLSGSQQPIQLELAEACRENRPPTVLATGSLGSGKTVLQSLLAYQAFLCGSSPIVDIDPKGEGDHAWLTIPEVAERTEAIELSGDERFRGMLDPLRVAPEAARAEVCRNFLLGVLPEPVLPQWRTEITAAVSVVAERERATVGDVLVEIGCAGAAGKEAARALEAHLEAGIARLGFGESGRGLPDNLDAQVVSLQVRDLVLPDAGTARAEMHDDERLGQAVLRLVAAYAMRLCGRERGAHSLLALDEAWALLGDSQGQALMKRLSRMGRSLNITPLLASQMIADAKELEPLVGAYFAFGVETDEEAARALALLRLDPDDEALRQQLVAFRRGRCLMRDFEGRVVPMRVSPGVELLAILDTTPSAAVEEPTAEAPPVRGSDATEAIEPEEPAMAGEAPGDGSWAEDALP